MTISTLPWLRIGLYMCVLLYLLLLCVINTQCSISWFKPRYGRADNSEVHECEHTAIRKKECHVLIKLFCTSNVQKQLMVNKLYCVRTISVAVRRCREHFVAGQSKRPSLHQYGNGYADR